VPFIKDGGTYTYQAICVLDGLVVQSAQGTFDSLRVD
jgi:hypothetical protein